MASDNLYIEQQPVYITDPSGRLMSSGLKTVQFPIYLLSVLSHKQVIVIRFSTF